MKKVVAFVGSPRKNGNIDTLVNEILKGSTENGVESKVYYLNDMNIRGCQGCLYCRKHKTCCLNDDMKNVYDDIKQADYVIIGSPVYICQVSAQTKLLMDRLYPLTEIDKGKHIPRFGNKKLIMVYSQAAPLQIFFRSYFKYTAKHLKGMGLKLHKTLVATKAFEINSSAKNVKLIEKAYNIGKKYII
ncbi:flavodoxin family protein [Clostridium sp. MSJ-11]|uniref:Flavodoxin family protein n=1 Tax=Clostridium mobile TaxID=2841512 RepID=A0ABS6EGK1_9CLOT|nr:flavodoxin family protein [Clostridium mobile]MBU5484336.1 flavodoxin family protein [Clostridium mobile]